MSSEHFQGKSVVDHLREARTRGAMASAEIRSMDRAYLIPCPPPPYPLLSVPANPLQPFPDAPLPAVTPDTRVRRAPEAAFQRLGEETVVVLSLTRSLHVLNPTGSFLWEALDRPRPLSELVDRLVEEFEVERPRAQADVMGWAAELKRQRALVDG